MVAAISVSTSGGNQSASGTKPSAAAASEIECATVNEVTMTTSGRSRRNGITRQSEEQQVVGAFEDVPEAGHHETQRGLVPARIERTRPGSPWNSNARVAPVRRQEAQHGRHF